MNYLVADRLANLGTETAFQVAAQAAAHAAAGNRVYPFHLGDMNLPTPSNIVEAANRAIKDGRTGYTPNSGIAELREALAHEINATRGTDYSPGQVSVQPGGKPVIGKFLLALMNPGDEVLYPNPGFPIYESQILFHGGTAVPYGVTVKDGRLTFDLDQLEKSVTSRTRLLIINDLHNPTGVECTPAERQRLAEIALRHNLLVLLDEAYFDIRYQGFSASLVSEPGMVERSVLLYTFSKRFAMTGWRLGAAIGPRHLIEIINKLNVNDESCSNHFVQYAGVEALTGDQSEVKKILEILKRRRDRCAALLNDIEGVSCPCPETTFYLYPDITEAMQNKGFTDYQECIDMVLKQTSVSLCARIHFGPPSPEEVRKYVRLAYSGIGLTDIEEGLVKLKRYFES